MVAIRGKDTIPEVKVRSILHHAGYRFRLHHKGLAGKPDIVLSRYKTVIFVNGCFWHRHQNCRFASIPKTRTGFWASKFKKNEQRDRVVYDILRKLGWQVIIVWECELGNIDMLSKRLRALLFKK